MVQPPFDLSLNGELEAVSSGELFLESICGVNDEHQRTLELQDVERGERDGVLQDEEVADLGNAPAHVGPDGFEHPNDVHI